MMTKKEIIVAVSQRIICDEKNRLFATNVHTNKKKYIQSKMSTYEMENSSFAVKRKYYNGKIKLPNLK